MTDEHDFTPPRVTPVLRARRPAFAQPRPTGAAHPIDELTPDLEPPWTKEDTDNPTRTATYTHPEGHHIGLRLQNGALIIQTWITAGPHLPPIPDGTDEEQAEAQAANDARLQPRRTWHATVTIRHVDNLAAAVGSVVRDQLIPALTNKPRRVPKAAPQPHAEEDTEAKAEPDPAPATKRRATPKKKATEK